MTTAAETAPRRPQVTLWDSAGARVKETPPLAWRVLQLTNLFRLFVTLCLLVLFVVVDNPRLIGSSEPLLFFVTALGYSGYAIASIVALTRQRPGLKFQVYTQVAVDILAVILLMHSSGGIGSNLGGLLIIFVGASCLAVASRIAFLFAAIATMAILSEQSWSQFSGLTTAADYLPGGMLGAIIFGVALAASPLARRIQESEALARQRGVDLANLAELNDYIIQHLRESIVVVDEDHRVRLINESAALHLGAPSGKRGMRLRDLSPPLHALLTEWQVTETLPARGAPQLISADGSSVINPQFAPLGHSGGMLVFLEDTSLLAERVQQSKLASLGRLSASIAHEIRNPVGAMSHASQLLEESPRMGDQERRLTDIISTNASRVSAIIDSVLALSRRDTTRPERIRLNEWLQDFADEFTHTQQLYEEQITVADSDARLDVRMDPMHLHQVVWNLCENSVKYASETAGAIAVELRASRLSSSGRPFLEVADRGPGIDPGKTAQIFEPFFTDNHGGTGLGLYISRELCELNRSTLLYEPRPGGGSVFRVVFDDPRRWESRS